MKRPKRKVIQFHDTITEYYQKNKRDFPWRKTHDPYAILVSEIMLQQTQTDRVVPKYAEWMKQFPTARALARAPLKKVLRVWSGLGYNRRALNLKRAAEMIVKEYGGVVPKTIEAIDALPGVGSYTAGAIAAFAFGIPSAFIETNIRTVYLHFFFKRKKKVRDEEILEIIKITTPPLISPSKEGERVRTWYNALMDYGAMLKETVGNPNTRSAHYAKQSAFKGSKRELRGALLRTATEKGSVTPVDFKKHQSAFSPVDIFTELVIEGFLKKEGKGFRLA